MLLIDGTFSFATPFCACIFNKHSNALHFILEPGLGMKISTSIPAKNSIKATAMNSTSETL
jgi:hypothetical protein